MTIDFEIDSTTIVTDYHHALQVTIEVISYDGEDIDWEIEEIVDLDTNKEYKFKELNKIDQDNIEELALQYGNEVAWDAFQEYLQSRADSAVDAMKEAE